LLFSLVVISPDEATAVGDPTGGSASYSGNYNSVNLSWTKGSGSNNTIIVRKASGYPTSHTDGTVVYNDTGTSYGDDEIYGYYYYSAFGYDIGNLSGTNATVRDSVRFVWSNGTYLYFTNTTELSVYSFDGDTYTFLDNITKPYPGNSYGIWVYDTYIYISEHYSLQTNTQLSAYSFNGATLSYLDNFTDFDGDAIQDCNTYGVYGDEDYIYYIINRDSKNNTLYGLSFDGVSFTEEGSINCENTTLVYTDGTYIYTSGDGINREAIAYSFDGSTFTRLGNHSNISGIIHGANGYLYGNYRAASGTFDYLLGITFDGSTFTIVGNSTLSYTVFLKGIFGMNNFVFTGESGNTDGTLYVYDFNGTHFSFQESRTNGPDIKPIYSVWADSSYNIHHSKEGSATTKNCYIWSPHEYSTTGLDFSWGTMGVSVFNESNHSQDVTFDIKITNSAGSSSYERTGCTNTYFWNITDIPNGDDTILYISATGYSSRAYLVDLANNNFYNYSIYLSPSADANKYFFIVINEYNEYLDGVHAIIRENASANVTITQTDGAGMFSADLIPNEQYTIILSKSGYITRIDAFIPDPTYYGIAYPKYYKLYFTTTNYTNETNFLTNITFTGEIGGTTLYTNFTDTTSRTTDTAIIIYEINGSTGDYTPIAWDNKTDNYDFTVTVTNINTSNCFKGILFMNHTDFGFHTKQFVVCGTSDYRDFTNKTHIDNLFDALFQTNPIGWTNFFMFIVMVACLFSFGQQNAGLALIVSGGMFAFFNVVVGLALASLVIPVLFFIFGILLMWRSHLKGVKW